MVAGLPSEQVAHVLGSLPGRVDLTGKRFGVYRYKTQGHEVEIALPRQDKYESSRRGEGVITVDHNLPVEEDLHRRDFTANSAAVSLDTGQLIDPHGAADDIAANRLRATHADSFAEDPTRLVRALTMHSRYGLNPDEETRHAMEANSHLLQHESPDALNKTLDKLFTSANPAAGIRLGHDTGVVGQLFPYLDENWDWDQGNKKWHAHPLGEHSVRVLDELSKLSDDPDLRMAALLHDAAKKDSAWQDPETGNNHFYKGPNGEGADHSELGAQKATDNLRALNYPTARINRVAHYIRHHELPDFTKPVKARQLRARVGDEHVDNLLKLRLADKLGQGVQDPTELRAQYERQVALVDQARKNQDPWHMKNLAINGNDVAQLGAQGPQIGGVLRNLLNDVVNEPMLNNREKLIPRAQQYVQAQPQ
jgi:tRNA nucleotidyltransferase (CCA-adding enzyme)